MRIAYFDCFAGISGDMALGALLDCGADRSVLDATVEALRLQDEVSIDVHHETRGHAGGTRVVVRTKDRHERAVPALRAAVQDSDVPGAVKTSAMTAIDLLARAEARIHATDVADLHLHELGGADTLVDVVGAFWLLHALDVAGVYASPLPAPHGRKGDMPLPAPASLRVLEGTGAVLRPVDGDRELVTPTGAAILAASAKFVTPVSMTLHRVGYGVGASQAPGNLLAVWLGEESTSHQDDVTLIETNLDDMAPNLIAPLVEDLMAEGALDVTVTPALMKKGRPGHVLAVIASPEAAGRLADHLIAHSTTLGVRISAMRRVIAGRDQIEVTTPLGTARVKVKLVAGRPIDAAPEFEDCRRISKESGIDLREVIRMVGEAARKELGLA